MASFDVAIERPFEGYEAIAPEPAERVRERMDEKELEARVTEEGYGIHDEELLGVDGGSEPHWPTMPEVCASYQSKNKGSPRA